MVDISAIQAQIRAAGLDGWLLYDFRNSNVLAKRVLQFPEGGHSSRRWFYFIPAEGEPAKLVHRIESAALDHLPGDKEVYLRWQELEKAVCALVIGCKRIAMEYSPRNGNPYVSRVDAGTVELVKSFGVEIVSSGDLTQSFEAVWDDDQVASHYAASELTNAAYAVVWQFIADEIRAKGQTTECAVQARIMRHFADNNMVTDHPPIVGQGPHAGDPHYSPSPDHDSTIKPGDFVLVDLWAKLDRPKAVYSDLTRTAFIGAEVPEQYTKIFNIVAAARDAAIALVRERFASDTPVQGWEVDRACRAVIEMAGYGKFFVHRTGHSIGQETHGNGANIDDLETHEERRIMRRTCFSIEPGIYLPEFGVRSEVDVYVDADGKVNVTGGPLQTEIVRVIV